jgi:hypothetical protein
VSSHQRLTVPNLTGIGYLVRISVRIKPEVTNEMGDVKIIHISGLEGYEATLTARSEE